MTRPVSRLLTISACALLGALLASAAAAERIDRHFEERFDVQEGARLELRHGDGEVVVTPWDENVIEIDVRYRVDFTRVGLGSDPDFDCTFDQSGDVVRVVGHEATHGGIGFFSMTEVEYVYRVRAPRYVALDLEGDDGNVEIEDWSARISLESDDGDVELRQVRGDVTVKVQDGDVDLSQVEGEIDVRSDDGDVEISDCASRRVRVDVQDGEVRIDRCEGDFAIFADDGDVELHHLRAGKIEVATRDGSIDLQLDATIGPLDAQLEADDGAIEIDLGRDVSARFELSTDDGRIRVDGAASDLAEQRRRTVGRFGDGEGELRATTRDGRITLRHAASMVEAPGR